MRSEFRLLLVLLACLALAACGSTAPSGDTATGAASSSPDKTRDFEFSDCMRAHGVTNFPDPSTNGGLEIPPNIDPQSPAFRSAQNACKRFLPNGGALPATPAKDRTAALTLARCMRSHGVPEFPDPAFSPPRNAPRVLVMRGMVFVIPGSVNPKSPAFQQAARACGFGSR